MKKQVNSLEEEEFLECEKLWIFILMIAAGGFFGAYTYNLKGGVFCNAQTANFVMMAIQIGKMNWARALYYLFPISAYILGAILSEFLPKRVNKFGILRWDTLLVGIEMLCILGLGFVPDDAPPQICQVTINFITAMQYNTFRQAKKVPMSTTFCTNHLRQIGVDFVKWVHKKDLDARSHMFMHILMLLAFVGGGIASTIFCTYFKGKAIWGAEILLAIAFIGLLRADLGHEKGKLNVVPHGH